MTAVFSLSAFLIDVLLVAILAWRTFLLFERGYLGLVETTLAWLLLGVGWVVGAGVVLGMVGGLDNRGFLLFHGAFLVLFSFFRRDYSGERKCAAEFWADWRRLLGRRSLESVIVAALIVGLVLLAMMASRVEPSVFDALTYRLSRIGQWLQDGRISSYATDDPRINYMPVGPDLMIGWLLGATPDGFLLAPLSQIIGGALVMGATFGLARTVGFSRLVALGAVSLVLGMANVAVQFTTIQSDLFTAGIFSSSYLLWHRAWVRGRPSMVGAVGVALALGSKGTMFYLAPGAAIWVAWLGWKHRSAWRAFWPAAAAGLFAALLFVAPSYWRNLKAYDSLLGPPEAVLLHHGPPLSLKQRLDKLCLNLETSAVQLMDPTAQPFWCRTVLRDLGRKFLPNLPNADDRYLFLHDFPRRVLAEGILQQAELDADIASCGVMSVTLLLLGGGIACWRWRDEMQQQVAVWSAGVVVYLLVQHAVVQWHQWAFRFAVIAAPWMAVAGASAISQIRASWRPALWLVVVLSCGEITWRAQFETHQAAWQSLRRPDDSMPQYVYSHWHAWAEMLDEADFPIRLALPINSPIAAFYRTNDRRPVAMEKLSTLHGATAEQALAGTRGWLVVPALKFMGSEGNVMGFTFLYGGEGTSANSLAAYRQLRPGEIPRSVIYRATRDLTPSRLHRTMLVRSWREEVRMEIKNPGTEPCHYAVSVFSQKQEGNLNSNESISLSLKVSAEYVSEIDIEIHSVSGNGFSGVYPGVILANP